jgi:hypothetical protein
MNLFWAIMGYTEKHKDIKEAIRDAKGTLGCPERGLAIGFFLMVILGCTDRKWSSHRDL